MSVEASGMGASPEVSAQRPVVRVIGSRSVPLVLDDMEHVLDAREFVASLVRSCSAAHVVVGSRVALTLVDEHRIAVDGRPVEPEGREAGSVA